MSFDHLPNEILLQIFSPLSFQDVEECLLVCRRFRVTITGNPHRFHSGAYRINEALSESGTIAYISTDARHTFVIYQNGGADTFSHSKLCTSIYRTVTYRGSHLSNVHHYSHMPDYSAVIYTTKSEPDKLLLLDLLRGDVVEIGVHEAIYNICAGAGGGSHFAVYTRRNRVSVYRLFGRLDARPIAELECSEWQDPKLSADGMLLYRKPDSPQTLHLFSSGALSDVVSFETASGPHLRINEEATLLAVHQENSLMQIFDVAARRKVFECETPCYGYMCANFYSPDSRFVAFQEWEYGSGVRILALRPDGHGQLVVDIVRWLMIDDLWFQTCAFRMINGENHLQLITTDGTIRLFKLDEGSKSWRTVN